MPESRPTPSPSQLHAAVQAGVVRCNATGFGDATAVRSVTEALDRWVSEYPDQARDVERLSLSAAYTALLRDEPAAAAQLGAPGIVASLIRSKPTPEDRAAAVLLALIVADAHHRQSQAREAQVLLDDAAQLLGDGQAVGALAPYLQQRWAVLAGAFAEAALDIAGAAQHYTTALEHGEPLLRNRIRLRSLVRQWTPLVFGDVSAAVKDGDELAAGVLQRDLVQTFRQALLGYGRTATDRAEGARRVVDASLEFGLPDDRSTLEMRPALLALPLDDLATRLDPLLERAAVLEDVARQHAWTAMIQGARARLLSGAAEPEAAAALTQAKEALKQSNDALTWAGGLGDLLAMSPAPGDLVPAFLSAYGQVLGDEPTPVLPLPLRVQFDEAIGVANEWAFTRMQAQPSPAARQALSVMLDALRSPDVEELPYASGRPRVDAAMRGELGEAYKAALDRLGRLHYAITRHAGACALVLQTVGEHVLIVAATGEAAAPLLLAKAGRDYLTASQALARGLADAIADASGDTNERIEALGRAAFAALPADVQGLIRRRHHVAIVPDFQADRDGIPFELFHDGQQFLSLGKVVSRAFSLRELVRALEPPFIATAPPRRAVCLAVPDADGLAPLAYAASEASAVQQTLAAAGWDAPELADTAIDAERLMQAMALAGVTHVAAHGRVYAGGEALMLPDGATLTVDDINERPRLFAGLVFLNACSLGRVRYLGAGVRNGIASALVRAGAPCVVTNLLPVEDRMAGELAAAFYTSLLDQPAGEALRRARVSLASRGAPPSRWGTTVLLGNPLFWVADAGATARGADDVTVDLLTRYSTPGDEHAPEAMQAALEAIGRSPEDVRLQAAIAWVMGASAIDADAPPASSLAAARVARALDCRSAEGIFLYTAAGALEDPAAVRRTLDRALWVMEPLAKLSDTWRSLHQQAGAQRQKLDARNELPFIDGGPVRVNDPNDAATQAILQLQHALDRQEIRANDPLRLRRPERSLADVTWNAIVLGQQMRFPSHDAQAGCATQLAGKLDELGLVAPGLRRDLARVLGGLLTFLWESQRLTHLERDRAIGQATTARLLVTRVAAGWTPEIRQRLAPVESSVTAVVNAGAGSGTAAAPGEANRFLRALAAIDAPADAVDPCSELESAIRSTLDACGAISPHGRAEAAAWAAGLLLEAAHECRRTQPPRLVAREQLLRVYAALSSDMERLLYPYLMDGYASLREAPLDFVQQWTFQAS